MAKIEVDRDICIGCNLCLSICPDIFEMRKDGKAQVQKGAESKMTKDVLEAKKSCPVEAIKADE